MMWPQCLLGAARCPRRDGSLAAEQGWEQGLRWRGCCGTAECSVSGTGWVAAPRHLHHSTTVLTFISPASVWGEHAVLCGGNHEQSASALGKHLECLGHRCKLHNNCLMPSSSHLAEVVLLNDALLRGQERGKCSVRLESFKLNQPPPTHYWHIKRANEACLITRALSLQLVCRRWFFCCYFFLLTCKERFDPVSGVISCNKSRRGSGCCCCCCSFYV